MQDAGGGLYRFVNKNTGRCITAPSWPADGPIPMSYCYSNVDTQLWRVYATGPWGMLMWQSAASGECLTTPSVANRTVPQTLTCDSTDQYDWWQL